MKPTLLVGDFILVEKFSYGLRLSGFNQSYIETGYPEYGDVIVFRYPLDQNDNYIKRIVGLPGDTISYKNKMIEINPACDLSNVVDDEGKCSEKMLIERRLLGHGIFNDDGDKVDMYEEKLGMNWHKILIDPQSTDFPLDNRWTVPEGYYFVMGDNRDKSNDSRYWGFVSENDLVGRAVAIWLHVEFENDWFDWLPSAISFDTTGRIQ
jgi:signal peptidase I